MPRFLRISLRFPSSRNVQQMLHICPYIIEFFHICSGLFVSRVGFPFLFQKTGIFLPERFVRGELFDSQLVKMILRCLVQ